MAGKLSNISASTTTYPVRLNFQTSEYRIALLENETAFLNLAKSNKKGTAGTKEAEEGRKEQEQIREILKKMDATKLYKNRDEFDAVLEEQFERSGYTLTAPLKKAIMSALPERDETADICTDKKGGPEPDAQLRDYENVPPKR